MLEALKISPDLTGRFPLKFKAHFTRDDWLERALFAVRGWGWGFRFG